MSFCSCLARHSTSLTPKISLAFLNQLMQRASPDGLCARFRSALQPMGLQPSSLDLYQMVLCSRRTLVER